MPLPNGELALIDPEKLAGYLLSETHPVGRFKAHFFRTIGFDESALAALREALVAIAQTGTVAQTIPSPFGVKYIVDGAVATPDGNEVTL